MGQEVCRAVAADAELDLVAAVDTTEVGSTLEAVAAIPGCDVVVGGELEGLVAAGADVVVDFTVAEAARRTLPVLGGHGIHAVVGTTGLTDSDIARVREAFTRSNCLVAPNFAVGAVLLMRFAELAAPLFETAELIELHHDSKIDAPSGTAMAILERMAAASDVWAADPTTAEVVSGARGGRGPGAIPVHSVRLRGLVAHHELVLGTTGQTLTIRHDSLDRSSFMPGVLAAVKKVPELPGLTLGLEPVLGL